MSHSYPIHTLLFFFFSSRRRHTRFDCDWSSDVCSSDLIRSDLPAGSRIRGAILCDYLKNLDWRHRQARKAGKITRSIRSEEHTSELQSQSNLVCRLLLEKKNRTLSPVSTGQAEALSSTP